MSHLDDRIIAELIDGELDTAARAAATAHLAACAECRARHAEALACAGESDRLIAAVGLPRPLGPFDPSPAPPWPSPTDPLANTGGRHHHSVRWDRLLCRSGLAAPWGSRRRGAIPPSRGRARCASRQRRPSRDQPVAEDAGITGTPVRADRDTRRPTRRVHADET
jgi:hypothetical protein